MAGQACPSAAPGRSARRPGALDQPAEEAGPHRHTTGRQSNDAENVLPVPRAEAAACLLQERPMAGSYVRSAILRSCARSRR
jgi:hypothetical protein